MKAILEHHSEANRFMREASEAIDQAVSEYRDADLAEYAASAKRILAFLDALLKESTESYREDMRPA